MKIKKLLFIAIATIAVAVVFTACGGGSSSGGNGGSSGSGKSSGKITMTTEEVSVLFYLAGSGVATVDWGDGSAKVSLTLDEYGIPFEHTYTNASIRTITINGDNITRLDCRYNITSLDVSRCTELTKLSCGGSFTNLDVNKNTALIVLAVNAPLTNLDVSKNTALTYLECYGVFTSLDVSKNTVLAYLNCYGNLLTSLALNALFGTLHNNDVGEQKQIYMGGNPGSKCLVLKKVYILIVNYCYTFTIQK